MRKHAVCRFDKRGRAQAEIVVGDRLRARHQAEGELRRLHAPEAPHVFEPHERYVRRMLNTIHVILSIGLEMGQSAGNVGHCLEGLEQADGILHRQFRSGTDGKMCGGLGVSEKHDIAEDTALIADHGEPAPCRAVGDQGVSIEVFGKNALQEGGGLLLIHGRQAGALEGVGVGFHDPGGMSWLILISMRNEHAVRGFTK